VLKIVGKMEYKTCIDIGSGDQYFVKKMAKLRPEAIYYSVDTGYSNSDCGRKDNIITTNKIKKTTEKADLMVLMDVLEHVQDDNKMLAESLCHAQDGANVIITVPAIQRLFSEHDAQLKHFRRYSRRQLKQLCEENNVKIESLHYFYFSLFVVRSLEKLFRRKSKKIGLSGWSHPQSSMTTRTITAIMNADFAVCSVLSYFRIHPPGLSLVLVGKILK